MHLSMKRLNAAGSGLMSGKRRQGRQRKQRLDDLTEWTEPVLLEDRDAYRRFVHAYRQRP